MVHFIDKLAQFIMNKINLMNPTLTFCKQPSVLCSVRCPRPVESCLQSCPLSRARETWLRLCTILLCLFSEGIHFIIFKFYYIRNIIYIIYIYIYIYLV